MSGGAIPQMGNSVHWQCPFRFSSLTGIRVWVDWTSNGGALYTKDLPDAGPFVGFRASPTTAGDTKWQVCASDGGVTVCNATTVAIAANTTYWLGGWWRPSAATPAFDGEISTVGAEGPYTSAPITTALPLGATIATVAGGAATQFENTDAGVSSEYVGGCVAWRTP